MPGFTIHIAVAKEYIKKHKCEIKDENEFIKGTIAPDLNENMTDIAKDKSSTHYGRWGNYRVKTDIKAFLEDPKVDISKDYWKGFMLHLLVDHYFYNKQFKHELKMIIQNKDKFYYDYDALNYDLISIYKIEILENIKKYMNTTKSDEEPKYLKLDKIIKFIDEISSLDLEKQIDIIKKYGMEGLA